MRGELDGESTKSAIIHHRFQDSAASPRLNRPLPRIGEGDYEFTSNTGVRSRFRV